MVETENKPCHTDPSQMDRYEEMIETQRYQRKEEAQKEVEEASTNLRRDIQCFDSLFSHDRWKILIHEAQRYRVLKIKADKELTIEEKRQRIKDLNARWETIIPQYLNIENFQHPSTYITQVFSTMRLFNVDMSLKTSFTADPDIQEFQRHRRMKDVLRIANSRIRESIFIT